MLVGLFIFAAYIKQKRGMYMPNNIEIIKSNFELALRHGVAEVIEESTTEFKRDTKLSLYTMLRLLIGAEGGVLAENRTSSGD